MHNAKDGAPPLRPPSTEVQPMLFLGPDDDRRGRVLPPYRSYRVVTPPIETAASAAA